jgi:predicted MFS family arabinose efflux permease
LGLLDRRIKIVLAANFIAVAARMSLVTFLGIWFVREARIELATVGVAFLCEHLLRGLAAPVFGGLSDRIGRRPLLIASALLSALVLPCFLLVDGPLALFAWSLALGLTGAVNMPVANALLLDLAQPERRQSALALNYTAMSVAYTLGVMPAGYVAEQGYGYLAASAAGGYLLVALLYLIALRAPLPLERAPHLVLFAGLRDPRLLRFAALAFVFPFSMGLVVSATPLFAADSGVGEGYIGLVLGANSILVAALALPVAARIEAAGPFRFLGGAALLVAAAHACYAAVPGAAAALLVGTLVFSFGEIVFSAAVPAAVARLAPPGRRGAYQGGWALVASLSMGSALFFSGVLRDTVGWRPAWLVYAGIVLVAAVLLLRMGARETGRDPSPGSRPQGR